MLDVADVTDGSHHVTLFFSHGYTPGVNLQAGYQHLLSAISPLRLCKRGWQGRDLSELHTKTEQANQTLSGIELAKSSSRAEGPKERRSTVVLLLIPHAPSSLTGNDSCCAPDTRKACRRWHCPCEDRPLRRSSECDLDRRGHLDLDGWRSKSLLFVGCTARSLSILGKGLSARKPEKHSTHSSNFGVLQCSSKRADQEYQFGQAKTRRAELELREHGLTQRWFAKICSISCKRHPLRSSLFAAVPS